MTDLKGMLKSAGMRCFVDYYHDFHRVCDDPIARKALVEIMGKDDRIKKDIRSKPGSDGPGSKVSSGCRIIREGLARRALESIVESKSPLVKFETREQAKKLLAEFAD